MVIRTPSLRLERRLLRSGATAVAGVDEVGRGAIAGPVTLGVVVVHAHTPTAPKGTRDSKDLSPAARRRLAPLVRAWAVDWAVGESSATEIDEIGIIAAMQRAVVRAFDQLRIRPDVVILDGRHDFVTTALTEHAAIDSSTISTRVVTRVGADRTCASVAGASILAKTDRDEQMTHLAGTYPDFGWDRNVGYATEEHRAGLLRGGPTPHHRRTFAFGISL